MEIQWTQMNGKSVSLFMLYSNRRVICLILFQNEWKTLRTERDVLRPGTQSCGTIDTSSMVSVAQVIICRFYFLFRKRSYNFLYGLRYRFRSEWNTIESVKKCEEKFSGNGVRTLNVRNRIKLVLGRSVYWIERFTLPHVFYLG